MKVKLIIIPDKSSKVLLFEKKEKLRALDILKTISKELGLPSSSLVLTRRGEVLADDDFIYDGDVIEVLKVFSGG